MGRLGHTYRSGKRLSRGENGFAPADQAPAAQRDREQNGGPRPVKAASSPQRRVWRRHPNGHSRWAMVTARAPRGTACPYSAGRKALGGFNDLAAREPRGRAKRTEAQ